MIQTFCKSLFSTITKIIDTEQYVQILDARREKGYTNFFAKVWSFCPNLLIAEYVPVTEDIMLYQCIKLDRSKLSRFIQTEGSYYVKKEDEDTFKTKKGRFKKIRPRYREIAYTSYLAPTSVMIRDFSIEKHERLHGLDFVKSFYYIDLNYDEYLHPHEIIKKVKKALKIVEKERDGIIIEIRKFIKQLRVEIPWEQKKAA